MYHEIRRVKVKDVKISGYNPRRPLKSGDPEYEKLKRSIQVYGYLVLLVINARNGYLIAGHQRLPILVDLGIEEVDAIFVDLGTEDEKALNILLNKIGSDWDYDKLVPILQELKEFPNFDVSITGFEFPEISQLIDRYRQLSDEDNYDFDKEVSSIIEPITKRGELIKLGPHRILCGDSTSPEDFKILMGDEKADMSDDDLPYNVNLNGGDNPNPRTRPKKSRKWAQIYSDNMPQTEYEAWMKKVFTNIKQFLKPGGVIYCWQGHRQFPPMYQILLELDFHISCVLCWLKESPTLTYGDYSFRTEQCLYGWLNGASHYWAGKPGESNVWEVQRDPTRSYTHPAQKPLQLAQKAIKNSSKINDIVLDAFLGSGSVLLGAESLGRRCYGLEIDPRYCDTIVKRYIAYFGKDKVSSDIVKRYLKED